VSIYTGTWFVRPRRSDVRIRGVDVADDLEAVAHMLERRRGGACDSAVGAHEPAKPVVLVLDSHAHRCAIVLDYPE